MRNFLPILLVFSYLSADIEDIKLNLNKPVFTQNSIRSCEGGVIKTDDVTIYARNFEYTKDDGEHKVFASGNLLIQFNRYFFVGDSITYDFNEKRGVIENGIGTVNNILSGGDKIYLYEDKSLEIDNAFITTSPSLPPVIEFTSPKVTVSKRTKAVAKTITGKMNGVPFVWLPGFGMTLDPKYKRKPSIFYTMRMENGQLPIFIGRYKIYNSDYVEAMARLEYRPLFLDTRVVGSRNNPTKIKPKWYEGIGGAIDLDCASEDKKITFASRNFVTYNIWYLDINPNVMAWRYRIQGRYKGLTHDDSVESLIQWDKLSDRFMRSYFKTQIFDIGTLLNNEASVQYRVDPAYVSIYAKPRLNEFRGFKQELPSFNIAARPIELFDSKFFLEQTYNASYLNYLYAEELRDILSDFRSGRLSTILNLYRPFDLGPLNITPRVGFDGIFYSNNMQNDVSWQGVCSYGGDSNMEFEGDFDNFSHFIKPYVQYNGLTSPTSTNREHYIFSISDGYASYNQLIFGLNNEFYLDKFPVTEPTFAFNLSAMRFFDTNSFIEPLSKGDIELKWHYPRIEIGGKLGWNFEKRVYDFYHVNFGWTINDYCAFSSEFRDRGRYWWRKDNHSNFIIDSFRLIDELDQTPLSDARYCIVNKFQVQLAPLWTFQIQNNTGKRDAVVNDDGFVVREPEPYYTQTKLVLSMLLSNSYRINLNYTFANNNQNNYWGFTFDVL